MGRAMSVNELLKSAIRQYDEFDDNLRISYADEYIQTLCFLGLIEQAEKVSLRSLPSSLIIRF